MSLITPTQPTAKRVLLVADWSLDPHAVVSICRRRAERRPTSFALLVPARLHGLDWLGDPAASAPCAHRQLALIEEIAAGARIDLIGLGVGEPETSTAIGDALAHWEAQEIVLCVKPRRFALPHPLSLTRRAKRIAGLPVSRVGVREGATTLRRPIWSGLRAGHCAITPPAAA